jgi:hypothetical protein
VPNFAPILERSNFKQAVTRKWKLTVEIHSLVLALCICKNIFYFVPIFLRNEKCRVGESRNTVFLILPISPLTEELTKVCNIGTQNSVKCK